MPVRRNVSLRVMTAPSLLPVHLRGEVEEELRVQDFRAVRPRSDHGVVLAADDVVEVDVEGLPVTSGILPCTTSLRVAPLSIQSSVQP